MGPCVSGTIEVSGHTSWRRLQLAQDKGLSHDYAGAKCLNQVSTGGENISLTYSPDGSYVAVGTKVSRLQDASTV